MNSAARPAVLPEGNVNDAVTGKEKVNAVNTKAAGENEQPTGKVEYPLKKYDEEETAELAELMEPLKKDGADENAEPPKQMEKLVKKDIVEENVKSAKYWKHANEAEHRKVESANSSMYSAKKETAVYTGQVKNVKNKRRIPKNCLAARAKVPYELKNYEIYFNWITEDFTVNNAEATFSRLKIKNDGINNNVESKPKTKHGYEEKQRKPWVFNYREHHGRMDYGRLGIHLLNSDTRTLLREFELTFLHCFFGEYQTAKSRLLDLQKRFKHLTDELMEGFDYIFNGFKFYMTVMEAQQYPCQSCPKYLKEFKHLNVKAQAFVLELKFYCSSSPRYYRTQTKVAEELALLQPQVSKWPYWVYRCCRDARRRLLIDQIEKEKTSIIRALQLEPNQPRYKFACCINLGDIIKRVICPFKYGDKEFYSTISIVDWMEELTRSLLKLPEDHDRFGIWYQDLACMFSAGLPKEFHNHDLAHQCLTRALVVSPDNSKIHNLMANLVVKAYHNFELAEKHLKLAMQKNPFNILASVDYVKLLMSNPQNNEIKIFHFFESNLTAEPLWYANEISLLLFLKGCFLVMLKSRKKHVIECWLEAFKLKPNADYFRIIKTTMWRFYWPESSFNLQILRSIILNALRNYKLERTENVILKKSLREVENLMETGSESSDWRSSGNTSERTTFSPYNEQNQHQAASSGSWRSSCTGVAFNQNPQTQRGSYSSIPDPMEENWRIRK